MRRIVPWKRRVFTGAFGTQEIPAAGAMTGSAEDVADDLVAVDTDETEASAARELSGCLKPLINTLAAADQQALQMVEFEGLTQVEAAARLGLSVSGMKSRVQHARSHLRVALDDCCRIALDRRRDQLPSQDRQPQRLWPRAGLAVRLQLTPRFTDCPLWPSSPPPLGSQLRALTALRATCYRQSTIDDDFESHFRHRIGSLC